MYVNSLLLVVGAFSYSGHVSLEFKKKAAVVNTEIHKKGAIIDNKFA